jgi:hypothetical protein
LDWLPVTGHGGIDRLALKSPLRWPLSWGIRGSERRLNGIGCGKPRRRRKARRRRARMARVIINGKIDTARRRFGHSIEL